MSASSIFDLRKSVPVIASFSKDGKLYPLYVRIDDMEYKVLSYVKLNKNTSGVHFECKIEDYGICKTIYLFYSINETAWFLISKYKPFT